MSSEGGGMHEHHEGMLPVVDSVDVSSRDDVHKLHGGAVGLWGVLFLTVTGSAPISAMLFNTPLSIGYGNGIGTPAGFMVATVVLTIFSVGYVAMARKVTAAGGFYSFISHGLGRELGMASGLAMVAAYSVFEVSLVGGFAYFAVLEARASTATTCRGTGRRLFMIALISVLAYFDVHISARVLGVALICEIVAPARLRRGRLRPRRLKRAGCRDQPGQRVQEPAGERSGRQCGRCRGGGRSASSSPSGRGSASRWPRTTARSRRTRRRSCRGRCTSRSSAWASSTRSRRGRPSPGTRQHGGGAANVAQNNAFELLLHPGQAVRQRVPEGRSQLVHHHGLVRLRDGLPQHDGPVHVLARPGGRAARALGRTHPRHRSPHIASITQSVIAALIVRRVRRFRHRDEGRQRRQRRRLHPGVRPDGGHGSGLDPGSSRRWCRSRS